MERPGAFHHARFMAKAIYYIKIFLLLPELMSREFITDLEKRQIEQMATYIILLYGQYFLETALTTTAPRLDIEFWRNDAKRYECIDEDISDAVVRSAHRQMFYLTEKLFMLALCERPQHFVPQKPLFKVDRLLNKQHDEPRLSDFVGPRSWLVFDLFDVDVMWVQFSPEECSDNLEFL